MALPFPPLASTLRQTEDAIAAGDFDAALTAVRAQIESWCAAPALVRNAIWGSRELDALTVQIGGLVAAARVPQADTPPLPPRDPERPLDVYLFTRTEIGGHVRVAGDLVRASPGRDSIVVLTEQHVRPVPPQFGDAFGTPLERVVCLTGDSNLDRTRTLFAVLERLRPDRVFAFNHHYDVAIVAAAGARAHEHETYYVHHADFLPALGVFMPHAAHLDLTPRAHAFCGAGLGLSSAYVPLVARDRGARPAVARTPGPIVVATCGGDTKYDLTYERPYDRVVAALLAATDARFVHIGPLEPGQLARIDGALRDAGVEPGRWRHVPFVPSVWDAMGEMGVDLYLNSFPQRGARVAVEVMGSGTPAVWHVREPASRPTDLHLAYPEAATWTEPSELIAIVRGIGDGWIARQRDAARAHYERFHRPSVLEACVASGFAGAPLPTPPYARTLAFEFGELERSWHRLTASSART